ncbi:NAD(P)-dependent dehydrogenase, short-chain alcohol dehydrogenase family [Parafrankia irregularis]|uniref:NAD(P)-dependent dehydrogenase, short-chain alcohol dehydrogenase family n=1 Tax=Parafrankia irregularis TaxID=795642 RepID=A0A0S4QK36_9ACTN|nr:MULTISPECIES: SDR family oxidoreductase [Parafrankia]MBE3202122.1 SDR family oxidoreductase [Parafrankia sp. CH37]CUU55904.1 NAD(P)-dependent dehydrogenase, short-chain alcohol dehydrogenase family [Parafrankia irregularis]
MTHRVAIVTGGARGQGAAVVRRLRTQDYAVVAMDLTTPESNDPLVVDCQGDVRSENDWGRAVEIAVERFGALHVLVNNAGVLRSGSIPEETADGMRALWEINCLGAFLGVQVALPALRAAAKDHDAAVVNTLSVAAVRGFANHSAYTSSKFALRGFTQSAAKELSRDRIRVNAVVPGPIATPMLDPSTADRLGKELPLGRAGTAQDVAEVVAFLASPAASFITGSEYAVDGGQLM